MNCKWKPDCEAAAGLLAKRVSKLPNNFIRNARIVLSVVLRQPAFRHPEGPEQDVPDRKRTGEVGVAALLQRRVMPAVKHWRRQHIFEWPERPVQVGMHERGMEGREWADPKHDVRRDASHQQD